MNVEKREEWREPLVRAHMSTRYAQRHCPQSLEREWREPLVCRTSPEQQRINPVVAELRLRVMLRRQRSELRDRLSSVRSLHLLLAKREQLAPARKAIVIVGSMQRRSMAVLWPTSAGGRRMARVPPPARRSTPQPGCPPHQRSSPPRCPRRSRRRSRSG